MSVRLRVSTHVRADPQAVWDVLVDWPGQARWIPLTTVEVVGERATGVGVRVEALSGRWLGPLPIGLLDRFVVTGWTAPADGAAELEVLHLGPYFTGEGVFALQADEHGTTVTATEMINLPAAGLTETLLRQTLPLMRVAFGSALRALGRFAEQG